MMELDRIRRECRDALEVVAVFDQTAARFPIDRIGGRSIALTCAEVTAGLSYPGKHRSHPGTFWPENIDLPLLWFFHANTGFDYYWLLEYDVRFSGHWRSFFDSFADSDSDLLATGMYDHPFRPAWSHWPSFQGPPDVPEADRTRATLSLYRVSRRALEVLHAAYRGGCRGHYEVTVPTVVKHAGLTLEDIGGSGAYVREGNRDRFYLNTPGAKGLAPGTFVLHEEDRLQDYIPGMLWNPFKN